MGRSRDHGTQDGRANAEPKPKRIPRCLALKIDVRANGATAHTAKKPEETSSRSALGRVENVDRCPRANEGSLGAVTSGGEEDSEVGDTGEVAKVNGDPEDDDSDQAEGVAAQEADVAALETVAEVAGEHADAGSEDVGRGWSWFGRERCCSRGS